MGFLKLPEALTIRSFNQASYKHPACLSFVSVEGLIMFDPRHVSFMQKLVVRRTSVHISRHAFTLHIYLIYDVQVPYSMIQYKKI